MTRKCPECGENKVSELNGLYIKWDCGHLVDSTLNDIMSSEDWKPFKGEQNDKS